jgi:hypothetical protein
MGAGTIASGRRPSMDRITTRRARGAGVGVADGVKVVVDGWGTVAVAVRVGGCVRVAVGVGGAPASGSWQASRIRIAKTDKANGWVRFKRIGMDSLSG